MIEDRRRSARWLVVVLVAALAVVLGISNSALARTLTDAETGAHLKWGISSNPGSRYSTSDLEGKVMTPIQTGTRGDMAAVERQLVEPLPGPLNREPWAGSQLGNVRFTPW